MNREKSKLYLRRGKAVLNYFFRAASLMLAASALAYILVSLSPIDPVQQYIRAAGPVSQERQAALRAYWGLNEPPVKRYFLWLKAFLQGNPGMSILYRAPVAEIVRDRFMNTLVLMAAAWLCAGLIGFLLGCLMGVNKGRLLDRVLRRLCLILSSVPTFWIGLLFLMVFSVWLKWFPLGLSTPVGILNQEVTLAQRIHHLILPAVTLSFTSFSNIALHTREKLVGVMGSNYVLFARARGETEGQIVRRHGLRNILLPAVTLQFSSFAELFGGSVLAENVFSYPGLGSAVSAAGLNSDVPLLLAITVVSTLFVFVGNSIANLIYLLVDPQIKLTGEEARDV